VTRDEVVTYLTGQEFDEDSWWSANGGPLVDEIENAVIKAREEKP
jgi:hypothetical protein